MHEAVGGRFVVTAGGTVRNVIVAVIRLYAAAHLLERFVEWVAMQVNIRDSHVRAMRPLLERQRQILERLDKLIIRHIAFRTTSMDR